MQQAAILPAETACAGLPRASLVKASLSGSLRSQGCFILRFSGFFDPETPHLGALCGESPSGRVEGPLCVYPSPPSVLQLSGVRPGRWAKKSITRRTPGKKHVAIVFCFWGAARTLD